MVWAVPVCSGKSGPITGFNAPEKYCNWAMSCDIPNLDPYIPSLTVWDSLSSYAILLHPYFDPLVSQTSCQKHPNYLHENLNVTFAYDLHNIPKFHHSLHITDALFPPIEFFSSKHYVPIEWEWDSPYGLWSWSLYILYNILVVNYG